MAKFGQLLLVLGGAEVNTALECVRLSDKREIWNVEFHRLESPQNLGVLNRNVMVYKA